MSATPGCRPWCTAHSMGECFTRVTIYNNGEVQPSSPPAPGSMAALFEYPKDIAWVSFVASQDEDDDEPVMDLHFFEAGQDEPITRMSLDKDTLQQVHRNLGAVLGNLA